MDENIKDKNVNVVKKLRDGMEICSVVNAAGIPYIITRFPCGKEEGSLEITSGYTIAEKAAEAIVQHYTHCRKSVYSFKSPQYLEKYISDMVADLADTLTMTSRRRIESQTVAVSGSEA